MLRRFLRKEIEKRAIFTPPWSSENEAPALSESSIFTFRRDPKKSPKMEPKWSHNGAQIRPNTYRGRSQSVPKKVTKIDPENRAKREPKRTPKITKNHEKRVSKNEVHHRRAPGAPQGRYWSHFGSNFGDFLVYVNVFPCVFNVFHAKINVFPCVYADLTLCFFSGNCDFTFFC